MNCLNAPLIRKTINSWAVGTTRQRVAIGRLGSLVLPVAPIEEQSRIVAKVDELMALCDKLEAQQQARRKLQNNLRQSTLQAVASATSPHELQTTWARLADNFGQLFHTPEDVEDLRKAVLDLAVSGYLSNSEESDEPASVLKLVDIYSERLRKSGLRVDSLRSKLLPQQFQTPPASPQNKKRNP